MKPQKLCKTEMKVKEHIVAVRVQERPRENRGRRTLYYIGRSMELIEERILGNPRLDRNTIRGIAVADLKRIMSHGRDADKLNWAIRLIEAGYDVCCLEPASSGLDAQVELVLTDPKLF